MDTVSLSSSPSWSSSGASWWEWRWSLLLVEVVLRRPEAAACGSTCLKNNYEGLIKNDVSLFFQTNCLIVIFYTFRYFQSFSELLPMIQRFLKVVLFHRWFLDECKTCTWTIQQRICLTNLLHYYHRYRFLVKIPKVNFV